MAGLGVKVWTFEGDCALIHVIVGIIQIQSLVTEAKVITTFRARSKGYIKRKKTSTPLADGYVEGGNLIALEPECTSQAGFQTCFEVHHYATLVQHNLFKKRTSEMRHTLLNHTLLKRH